MYNPKLAEAIRKMRDIALPYILHQADAVSFAEAAEEAHTLATTPELTLEDLVIIYLGPIDANLKAIETRLQHAIDTEADTTELRISVEHYHAQKILLELIIDHYKNSKDTTHDSNDTRTD